MQRVLKINNHMNKKITVSLTEFMRFVTRTGAARITVVENVVKKQTEVYDPRTDYWRKLRIRIQKFHSKNLSVESFKEVVETVNSKMQNNYNKAVIGYLKFVGRKKFVWAAPPKIEWKVRDLSVILNPEVGLKYKGETYYIKLFLDANKSINRSQANMIIALMRNGMNSQIGDNSVFAVLDVIEGKLFKPVKTRRNLYVGLLSEAEAFESSIKRLS